MNHRDYVEAHLTLLGWVPTSEGRGGAYRDGVAIYTYSIPHDLDVIHVAEAQRNVRPQIVMGMWLMSDDLFWPLVHYIKEHHEP